MNHLDATIAYWEAQAKKSLAAPATYAAGWDDGYACAAKQITEQLKKIRLFSKLSEQARLEINRRKGKSKLAEEFLSIRAEQKEIR